jgi:molybdate transport system substrate-binding protein
VIDVFTEIKVLSTHAVIEVLAEFAPAFEKETGHTFTCAYNPTAVIKREIEAGTAFDVAIITKAAIAELAKQGKILGGGCKGIACCGLGISVRADAPKPDISTVDMFKRTLFSAKSIVHSRDGVSGQYFETLIERLGIADTLRSKIVVGPGGRVGELIVRGDAEIAVQQIPELMSVVGAGFVGPLPQELQLYTYFTAGVAAASNVRNAAQAFVDMLAAPSVAPLLKAKGLEPIPP